MRKWIEGYEGLYEIEDTGLVYRYNKSGVKTYAGTQHPTGYLKVALCKNSKATTYSVHKLVADAFLQKEEGKIVVDHIDEDKTNNNVSNLRWCTVQENNKYYDTKDGRRYAIEEAKKRKGKLKEYEKALQEKTKLISTQAKELAKAKLDIEKAKTLIATQKAELEELRSKVHTFIDNEVQKLQTSIYQGYMDTKGITFRSVDEMVKVTGKSVTVNGNSFDSCGSAATYIVAEELKLGNTRNQATISKELRRYLQGLRPSWEMFTRYKII